MRHLLNVLKAIRDFFYLIFFWLVGKFGEITTYLGIAVLSMCLVVFFPNDLLKGLLLFGTMLTATLLISYKEKR